MTMARSIVIKQFTFAMFECHWFNNMIQHLKHWQKYCIYSSRCMWNDNVNFGLLSCVPWNIQGVPGGKDLTSGECSLGQTIPI
jgi:hypothetical protein